jgi:carbon storage regulator
MTAISRRPSDRQEAPMLVLCRKPSQRVLIGPDISITIVRIDRNQVRIGISAPPNVPILRHELVEKRLKSDAPALVQPAPVEVETEVV